MAMVRIGLGRLACVAEVNGDGAIRLSHCGIGEGTRDGLCE